MSKNLHLQHKFIDRGGRDVYEIFAASDNKTLLSPLGEVRLDPTASEATVRWVPVEKEADKDCEQLELDLSGVGDKYRDLGL